jgi:uroporphyrinogen-III synthase
MGLDSKPLAGKWIAITRPAHQVQSMEKLLLQAGANVVLFPLLEIVPLENAGPKNIQAYDLLIFVSPNSVLQALKWLTTTDLETIKIAAVGKKTAALLKENDIAVDVYPKQSFNSEALLALPDLQPDMINGHRVAIVRGKGGRNMLRDTLQQRGANVTNINIYQRHCPQKNANLLKQHWQRGELDIIMLTSASSVTNLFKLAGFAKDDWLNQLTLLLGSERMQQALPKNFKGRVLLADDPSDETLIKQLTHG